MNQNLANRISITQAIAPQLLAATATSAAVDLANYGSATIIFNPDTITDGTHTPSVTECDTLAGTYTTVAAGDLSGTLAALASTTPQAVDYKGGLRFIKAKVTVTGAPATGGQIGALIVRGTPSNIAP